MVPSIFLAKECHDSILHNRGGSPIVARIIARINATIFKTSEVRKLVSVV